MDSKSELNPKNYRRIFWINCLLWVPLLLIFAWPYLVFSEQLQLFPIFMYSGAFMFSVPFTLTILHGHVTLALGSAHRHHYYNWLQNKRLTYGPLFHPIFTSTRFRLILFTISLLILLAGWLIHM